MAVCELPADATSGFISTTLAEYIRRLGYSAKAHYASYYDIVVPARRFGIPGDDLMGYGKPEDRQTKFKK